MKIYLLYIQEEYEEKELIYAFDRNPTAIDLQRVLPFLNPSQAVYIANGNVRTFFGKRHGADWRFHVYVSIVPLNTELTSTSDITDAEGI